MPNLDTATWLLQLSLASPTDRALRSRSAGVPIMRVPRSRIPCRACPSPGGLWLVWTWRHRTLKHSILAHDVSRYVHQKHALRLRIVRNAGTRRGGLQGWRMERETIRCLPIPDVTAPQHARSQAFGTWAERAHQSIDQSINHPDPAHQSISRFRAPAARYCKSDVMGAVAMLAHVSPTLYNTWRRGGGPHTILHMYCNRDSCIAGIQGLCAPLISIGCVTDLRKRKSFGRRFQTRHLHLHSRRTVHFSRVVCTVLGHLHDPCRRRDTMMARSSWIV